MFSRRVGRVAMGWAVMGAGAWGLVRPAAGEVHPHGGMLRYPDVSATHIVFAYANDLWLAPREGGLAVPLASPPGVETFPRFSPDGQTIAFVGNYDGNVDLYTIPVTGGVPVRVTYHPASEALCDWSPDGRLIFQAEGRGEFRFLQLFIVDPAGGLPERLPVPYGGNGSISPDGSWLAYTPSVRDQRTWKRYRGGMASDIWLFHLKDHVSKRITDWEGTDSLPMWHGDKIYYVSDAGPEHRLNIWEYQTGTGRRRQITHFEEFDVKWPSIGPGGGAGEIVFQNGPNLYLLDLKTGESRRVEITIPGDRPTLRPQRVDVRRHIHASDVSSTGKRAVFEARGDIWTVPAKEGIPRNLTRTSGIAERDPAWSPDGRWIAYFSDADGEYDLYLAQSDGKGQTRKLAALGPGYRYMRGWSPDSKYVSFVEKSGAMMLCRVETPEGEASASLSHVDTDPAGGRPPMSWSHDSRWIAYTRSGENNQHAIWLYEVETGSRHQLTSGMFHDFSPVFDRRGDYLFFASSRSFESPIYEDVGSTFVYTGTHVLVALPLRTDVKYPWTPRNDEETWDEKKEKQEGEENGEKEAGEQKPGADQDSKNDQPEEPAEDDGVSGVWEGTLRGDEPLSPDGLIFTLTLRVGTDGSVSGSMSGGPYVGRITDGSYAKSSGELTFSLEVQTPEGTETFSVAARVSNGSMSGTVAGPGFSASFEATRTSAELPGEEEVRPEKEKAKPRERVEIELAGAEQRALLLPVARGHFGDLAVNDKNQLLYVRRGLPGSGKPTEIQLFDLEDEKKEEKTVLSGAGSFSITADGKKLLARMGGSFAIVEARPGQKVDDRVPLDGMIALVDPREEWQQLFLDTWRIQRDFFYVANMHGVDWPAVREQYRQMLADCVSREDVAYVISEMISELNVGHAYYMGGPTDVGPSVSVGMLGADFELHEGAYRIKRIHAGGPADVDARGPLSQPGVNVKEGDYLLAVNGIPLDVAKEPWAAFQGLADRTVLLTVSDRPVIDESAREITVKLLSGEENLRYRSWVEANRKYVEEKTGGRVGYIHVPDTGINGQNELFRQFYGQRDKDGLIIDERWNRGGQLPVRFIELLNRPLLNYWAVRDGRDRRTPADAHFGPKCMLINWAAGSGGDMLPALFRQVGLGKLIGQRTWGGLVGISGNPRLIDGTFVSVPTFGYYRKDGTWGIEGHGVDPDIEVIDDPALMVDGGDPQLEAAIAHMLAEIELHPPVAPPRPPDPDRSGMGIREEDK